MAYKIRVILDVEEDVLRDIVVKDSINLEDLHFTIAKSFGFKGQEMAAFYETDDNWEQGTEIPLFDMSEDEDSGIMQNYKLKDILKRKGEKLIYVYDFFSMWTFFIELLSTKEKEIEAVSKTVLSVGQAPDEAPEKEFVADDSIANFDEFDDFDDLDDEGFENIDDYDF
jgi:hypothetical protein